MSDAGLRVEGGARLRRTLRRAGADLGELKATNRTVAGVVATAARPNTPRLSGALGGTVRAGATNSAAIVRAGNNTRVPYAQVIHWTKRPWISQAAQGTEAAWVAIYYAGVERALATVKGA